MLDQLRRTVRLAALLMVVGSVFVGGLAFAAQNTTLAGPFASLTSSPGKSGPTKPGKGCGDKNHYHERESKCKKPPK